MRLHGPPARRLPIPTAILRSVFFAGREAATYYCASGAERFPLPSDRPMEAMMRAPGLIRETVSDAS